ncbi:MAG: HD domain-containing phosphohydrolase [Tissierellaceae bacterium]
MLSKAINEKATSIETGINLVQSFFTNIPIAIIIYEVMGDGASGFDYIIRGANPKAIETENWHDIDVLGESLGKLRPGVDDFGIVDIFRAVWETGETVYYPAKVYQDDEEYRWFENTVFKLPTGEIVAVYDDVTNKKLAEEELYAEKEKLKVTLFSIGDGVITTDKNGKIEMINKVTEELTGWSLQEAKGKPLSTVFDIFNEETGQVCSNPAELVLKYGKTIGLANHTVLRSRDGIYKVIADSAAPIIGQKGDIQGVVLVFRDVTEAKQKEDKIKYLSFRDSLTGLYNRTFFEEELRRLDVEDQLPLTFIMGDLDGLKLINDIFGHQVGDEALVETAKVFRKYCRDTDIISRWGGDEFVILLPRTSEDVGQKISDRVKKACSETMVADTKLSISIGYASKTHRSQKWQDVLKEAEDNMYKTKLLGAHSYRNKVLTSMKNALFEKSNETEEHGERLGYFCSVIGNVLNLSSIELDELELFSMLHDIGKIGIEDGILEKPGPLTDEEWKIMKTHPEIGYRMAQGVPELINIAEYILSHHERWDGSGYPRNLKGREIPLAARILAVADAYDAMTNDRPYRAALSPEEARKELRRNSGSQFDPDIVDIFLTHLADV